MIEIIGSLIAGIVVFYYVLRKRKPEPFEPKLIDVTLDLEAPE